MATIFFVGVMFGAAFYGGMSDRWCFIKNRTVYYNKWCTFYEHSQKHEMFCIKNILCLACRFGRKPMLLVSYISGMAFALASVFSSSFIMFAVLRFFSGFTITGIVIVSSVLSKNLSLSVSMPQIMIEREQRKMALSYIRVFLQMWSGWTFSTGD